jgi:hypothetical protein
MIRAVKLLFFMLRLSANSFGIRASLLAPTSILGDSIPTFPNGRLLIIITFAIYCSGNVPINSGVSFLGLANDRLLSPISFAQ